MSLKRRQFTKEFKQMVLQEIEAGGTLTTFIWDGTDYLMEKN